MARSEGAALRVRVEDGRVSVVECLDAELCSLLEKRGYLSEGVLDALG